MPRFAAGVVKFQNDVYPKKKELFQQLAAGQSPEALFISCSDSRVETAMITQSDPGDLFICRNAGNIVPPHTEHAGAMTASIEFAASALEVPHIVVCGHTDCGAMKGAQNIEGLDTLPHVRKWLSFSMAAVRISEELGRDMNDEERMMLLIQQNVILQLTHLKTHPAVAARLARGDLTLHGWVYDIKDGHVDAYDEATSKFEPVDQLYAEEVAKHLDSFAHKH
ncbi:MAG: carbonic anhydrase [Parvularcula sp.]